jgi:hypothetical protein
MAEAMDIDPPKTAGSEAVAKKEKGGKSDQRFTVKKVRRRHQLATSMSCLTRRRG